MLETTSWAGDTVELNYLSPAMMRPPTESIWQGMLIPHLCKCHNQVGNPLTKNQFLNGVNIVAAAQCHKSLKTSAVIGGTVFHNQGNFINFVWMQNIYNFVQRIRQTSAMTDKTVAVVLFAKLPIEIIF